MNLLFYQILKSKNLLPNKKSTTGAVLCQYNEVLYWFFRTGISTGIPVQNVGPGGPHHTRYPRANAQEMQRAVCSQHIAFLTHTERLFVRVNHKNELYFSIISFKNEENRVYTSEINIVFFKR